MWPLEHFLQADVKVRSLVIGLRFDARITRPEGMTDKKLALQIVNHFKETFHISAQSNLPGPVKFKRIDKPMNSYEREFMRERQGWVREHLAGIMEMSHWGWRDVDTAYLFYRRADIVPFFGRTVVVDMFIAPETLNSPLPLMFEPETNVRTDRFLISVIIDSRLWYGALPSNVILNILVETKKTNLAQIDSAIHSPHWRALMERFQSYSENNLEKSVSILLPTLFRSTRGIRRA